LTEAKKKDPNTYSGKLGGLRWEAESCPDATTEDSLKLSAGGGLVGFASALLMGLPPQLRLVVAAAGAIAGAVASKYHLNVDWDPDAFRQGSPPPGPDEPGDLPLEDPQPL
jgi:hypothetical protein